MHQYSASLKALAEEFHLAVAYCSSDYEQIRVTVDEVSRPGLTLVGYYDHFESRRMQVLGYVEMSYLDGMTGAQRSEFFDRFFSYGIPALVISRGQQPHPECVAMARKHDVTILLSEDTTSSLISGLITSLKNQLAPRTTMHGVLVEVYGEGLLLTGESGIGKSETAVELLKRGHRLIADDAVEIKKISSNRLMGSASPLIRNFIELRGIGIINVAKLYGMASIKDENLIDLVINIVPWDKSAHYDRMGLDQNFVEILGAKVPSTTIPVTPGRNLAVILEVAAMNNRQKRMGYNAAVELNAQIDRHFDTAQGDAP